MENRFNEDGLILSEGYADTMKDVVLPYLKQRETDMIVSGNDDKPLFASVFDCDKPSHGSAFIVHGFTENAYKYSELIYSLLNNGFSVVAYDQRGHGRSWRDEDVEDKSLTHASDFDDYEKDLTKICEAMEDRLPKPWSVFCHSMGGAVTGLFLIRHKGVFSRAAMCAPMIAMRRKGLPYYTGRAICRAAKLSGKGKARVFFSSPYSGHENFETSCATGKERFDWYDDVKANVREFQNNGASYSWLLESLKVTQYLLMPGFAGRIDCPIRVYTAENDRDVLPSAQEMFVRALKNGKRVLVKNAKHEIYRSDDETLFPWWHGVLAFLKGEET